MSEIDLKNSDVPDIRVRTAAPCLPVDPDGDYVVYWMIGARRANYNFGLQRAADWANELDKPLIVFEALRCSYQWNCDRFHAFVIQGMVDNAAELDGKDVTYFPYVETERGHERGLLRTLAEDACVVVSDDFPCFFLPRVVKAASRQIGVRLELVDSNGLYPMHDTEKVFSRAYDFRRHLQKNLLPHLELTPKSHPVSYISLPKLKKLPSKVTKRWPATDVASMANDWSSLEELPINHDVGVVETEGGSVAANEVLNDFLKRKLEHYDESRNEPEKMMTSGLSPYLHFGHISVHQVFEELCKRENWKPSNTADKANGKSSGWWGMSEPVESFLDEIVTWREVGYNRCALTDDFDQYDSLPDWAKKTLAEHESDDREFVYSLEEFEHAQTHDQLWNAAQRQLTSTGVIHNYLRMLWGKKILEWANSPRDALEIMIELNNKYALDGRNPNSYSGIFWVLGRYDRAWQERPIFGKIRYMTSENTARKVKVKNYIKQFSPASSS